MIDKKHFYKSFPLFGIVGVAEDMTDKNLVWSFSDISSKNLPYKIDIAHIIRMDGAYDDESIVMLSKVLACMQQQCRKALSMKKPDR